MTKNKLENISNEEIQRRLKGTRTLSYFMIIIFILSLGLLAFLKISENYEINTAVFASNICLLGGIVFTYSKLKVLKSELKNRQEQHSS